MVLSASGSSPRPTVRRGRAEAGRRRRVDDLIARSSGPVPARRRRPGRLLAIRAPAAGGGAPRAAPDRSHDRARRGVFRPRAHRRSPGRAANRRRGGPPRGDVQPMLDRIEHGVGSSAGWWPTLPASCARRWRRCAPIEDRRSASTTCSEGRGEVLESAREEVDRMSARSRDLLTLASVDEGRLELLVEPLDLDDVVARAVTALEIVVHALAVTLTWAVPAAIGAGDADRLEHGAATWSRTRSRPGPAEGEAGAFDWEAVDGEVGVDGALRRSGVAPDIRGSGSSTASAPTLSRTRSTGAGLGRHDAGDRVGARRPRPGSGRRGERRSASLVRLGPGLEPFCSARHTFARGDHAATVLRAATGSRQTRRRPGAAAPCVGLRVADHAMPPSSVAGEDRRAR